MSDPSPFVARWHEVTSLHAPRVAIADDGGSVSFGELAARARSYAARLAAGRGSLDGARVVLLAPPSAEWVAAFWGVLLAGGVAVPLSAAYPPGELEYFANDAGASLALVSELEHAGVSAAQLDAVTRGRAVVTVSAAGSTLSWDGGFPAAESVALLLYTSGTTGKPKGAMISHRAIATQTSLLRDAWELGPRDVLLHALPLHHLHGLVISLCSALLAGASARMLPRFDAERVWSLVAEREAPLAPTVWMAVPTMYQRLFEAFERASESTQARLRAGAHALRLATSGSAALPVTQAERWAELAGAVPLERFGMTEIGVGASNPLHPAGRRAGHVGAPLPTVEHRIVGDDGRDVQPGEPGELWIRGPSLFSGYWGRPEASAEAFSGGGWFRTGDVAVESPGGSLRLLGRTSVDILKSGGYKLSALEIEEVLREHPAVAEVAVVGLPDEAWGDRVVAAVVARARHAEAELATERVREFCRERLASYKLPREVVLLDELPRNALGKVQKPELVRALQRRP